MDEVDIVDSVDSEDNFSVDVHNVHFVHILLSTSSTMSTPSTKAGSAMTFKGQTQIRKFPLSFLFSCVFCIVGITKLNFSSIMTEIHDSPKSKQIRTLLLVFGTAISAAVLFALFMLHYYGPSGAYLAKNTLLEPSNLMAIRFAENNSRSGDNSRYVFDGFEFSFFDKAQKQWKRIPVDMTQYTDFYTLIGDDWSLTSVPDDVVINFNKGHPASLSMKVRQENTTQPLLKDLLKVDFAEEGSYFRIQLRENGPLEGWAYYYYPNIYHDALKLFVKTP